MGKIDDEIKNRTKGKLKKVAIGILIKMIPVLIIIVLATQLFTVFSEIKDIMIDLMSNIGTSVTSFWKNFTDDYWIKLDKETTFNNKNEETRRDGRNN